jgi:hypothetical protein
MTQIRKIIWSVFAAAPLFFSLGCDIFATRDAETPGTSGTQWFVPDLPDKVFINLINGLKDLTGENYEKSLGDAFVFIPLPADVDKLGSCPFEGWVKTVEAEVTRAILAEASAVEVSFVRQIIRNESDFVDYRVIYELTITYKRGGSETFKGVAQFDMQRLGNGWHLIRWTDQEGIEGFATWGYLRGETRGCPG